MSLESRAICLQVPFIQTGQRLPGPASAGFYRSAAAAPTAPGPSPAACGAKLELLGPWAPPGRGGAIPARHLYGERVWSSSCYLLLSSARWLHEGWA